MGSFGAACATFVSYFIMFALAFIFVRRHVKLKVFILRDVIAYGLLIAESVLVIRNTGNFFYWNAGIVFILICLYLNEIRDIFIKGTEMIKRRAQ
jgi:Na+-driven multidrug efflux pump